MSRRSQPLLTSGQKKLILFSGLILAVGTAAVLWLLSNSRPTKIATAAIPTALPAPTATPVPPSPSPEPGFTMLLMGMGGANHDGGELTDTMLLVRVLDTTQKILLLSIPRDLWLAIPHDGIMTEGKINSANALGGGKLAEQVVSQVTGLNIDKYLTLDFSGFEQAIDSIGGVDVNVGTAFTDYEYPITGREDWDCSQPSPALTSSPAPVGSAPSIETSLADLIANGKLDPKLLSGLPAQYPCRYELLHFDTGLQHMDGVTALKFVRSRHSAESGDDFARGQRQQQIILAVVNKLFSLGEISKLPTFIATLRSHLDTDLNAGDLISLLPRAPTIHSYEIVQEALTIDNYLYQTFTPDKQFALFPLGGEGKYEAIQNWISASITPGVTLKYPVIQVEAPDISASTSANLVSKLESLGYPVLPLNLGRSATSSATLILNNSNVDAESLQSIENLAGILPAYVSVAKTKVINPGVDLKALLP